MNTREHYLVPVLEEPFLLVFPKGYEGPEDDIEEISKELSLVRFGATTPVGRRTDQHLQRCRLTLPRAIEADRSSKVVAGVATGKCFAILPPSLLIDGVVEGMPLRLAPLPFAWFKRGIQVAARRDELGDIPRRLAQKYSAILRASFDYHFADFADEITYGAPD